MQILVLNFSGIGLREIPINGLVNCLSFPVSPSTENKSPAASATYSLLSFPTLIYQIQPIPFIELTVVKEKIPMDNFQVSHRYKVNCSNVLGMIATGDGGLLLCDYSEKKGGVVVYGENGKYIKKVTLKDAPFELSIGIFSLTTVS
jgi:hypothetical protein